MGQEVGGSCGGGAQGPKMAREKPNKQQLTNIQRGYTKKMRMEVRQHHVEIKNNFYYYLFLKTCP